MAVNGSMSTEREYRGVSILNSCIRGHILYSNSRMSQQGITLVSVRDLFERESAWFKPDPWPFQAIRGCLSRLVEVGNVSSRFHEGGPGVVFSPDAPRTQKRGPAFALEKSRIQEGELWSASFCVQGVTGTETELSESLLGDAVPAKSLFQEGGPGSSLLLKEADLSISVLRR